MRRLNPLAMRYRSWLVEALIGLILCGFSLPAAAASISVAVASNFISPMQDIAREYEQQFAHSLSLVPGSSGKLFAQISNGAPFQVFLSADQSKPQKLIEQGWAVAESRVTYAYGRLLLWSPRADLIKTDAVILKTGDFRRLALANPRLAPYGRASVQTLQALGVHDVTQARWVQGENIAQTFQFVFSGNADLGFVALSQWLALSEEQRGSWWPVPSELHEPIRQDAVLLESARDNPAAHALMSFLLSPQVRSILHRYGYANDAKERF